MVGSRERGCPGGRMWGAFTTGVEFRDRVAHPYIPRSLVLDGYVPQKLGWEQILGGFGVACAAVAAACVALCRRRPHLSAADRWLFVWFVVSGLIHLVIEGTFAAWTDYYKDTTGNFLAEICASPGARARVRGARAVRAA